MTSLDYVKSITAAHFGSSPIPTQHREIQGSIGQSRRLRFAGTPLSWRVTGKVHSPSKPPQRVADGNSGTPSFNCEAGPAR